MRFLTILYYQDGRYAGTQGHSRLLPDTYRPPNYTNPGETEEHDFIAHHIGVAESVEGQDVDVSVVLAHALEPHPDSTPAAPRFAVKDLAAMPQIHDAPVVEADFPAWIRKYGHRRLPKFYKTFLTLHHPELAKAHGLHRGISIADMQALEKSMGVPPARSHTAKFVADQATAKARHRTRLFERNREQVHARLSKGA